MVSRYSCSHVRSVSSLEYFWLLNRLTLRNLPVPSAFLFRGWIFRRRTIQAQPATLRADASAESTTAKMVKPFDFKVGKRALSHLRVLTAWCCSNTSETISMQTLFTPFSVGFSLRNALVNAMSMSVRFSTPLSLEHVG